MMNDEVAMKLNVTKEVHFVISFMLSPSKYLCSQGAIQVELTDLSKH